MKVKGTQAYSSVQLGIIWVMQTERFYTFHTAHKKQKTINKTNKQNKKAKNQKKAKLIKAVSIHCDFGVLISRPVIPIGSTKTFIIS